jgi:hypothetical protein
MKRQNIRHKSGYLTHNASQELEKCNQRHSDHASLPDMTRFVFLPSLSFCIGTAGRFTMLLPQVKRYTYAERKGLTW